MPNYREQQSSEDVLEMDPAFGGDWLKTTQQNTASPCPPVSVKPSVCSLTMLLGSSWDEVCIWDEARLPHKGHSDREEFLQVLIFPFVNLFLSFYV